jgi:hypothetical protein
MAYVNELINAEISRKYCEIVIDNGLTDFEPTDQFIVSDELIEKLDELGLEIYDNDSAYATLLDALEMARAIHQVIG